MTLELLFTEEITLWTLISVCSVDQPSSKKDVAVVLREARVFQGLVKWEICILIIISPVVLENIRLYDTTSLGI